MALKITFTAETATDLGIYLNFESAANGDTGRVAALATLAASYEPSEEYPTLADAQAALIAARTARANEKAAGVLMGFSVAHAKRMDKEAGERAEIARREAYDAQVDAMAVQALGAIVVEVVEP